MGLRLRLRADHDRRRRDLHLAPLGRTATRRPTPTRWPATPTRTPARRRTTTASPAPAAPTRPAPRRSTASSATTPDVGVPRRQLRHLRPGRRRRPGALRFSYATDPGLARPGWFIDDVKVTATEPGERAGSCWTPTSRPTAVPTTRASSTAAAVRTCSTAQQCTQGWEYVEGRRRGGRRPRLLPRDARPLRLRPRRQGPDRPRPDRLRRRALPRLHRRGARLRQRRHRRPAGPVAARQPRPSPGNETPDLNDAAFTAAAGAVDVLRLRRGPHRQLHRPGNTGRPATPTSPTWQFRYDCLAFDVTSMTGDGDGPGDVRRRPDRRRDVHDGRRAAARSTTATARRGAAGQHRARRADATATPTGAGRASRSRFERRRQHRRRDARTTSTTAGTSATAAPPRTPSARPSTTRTTRPAPTPSR